MHNVGFREVADMKTKFKRTFCLLSILVISLHLTVLCWAADIERAKSQVKQTVPKMAIAKPSPPKSSIPQKPASVVKGRSPFLQKTSPLQKGKVRGKLSLVGKRARLRLNCSVSKVELFSGRKKLAVLGAGRSFDITPYLRRASINGLIFHYFQAKGQENTQIVSPGEIKKLSKKIQKGPGRPVPMSPPKPASVVNDKSPFRPKLPVAKSARKVQVKASAAAGIPNLSTAPAAINITRPALGDFMVEGDQFVLQWSGVGNIQEHCVNIYLRKVRLGFDYMTIAENVCINGYRWQLPPGVSGTNFTIRIKTIDNALKDDSAPFSILSSQPDLEITNLHIKKAKTDMLDDITVEGDIQNSGHGTAISSQATVKLWSGDWTSSVRTVNIPALVFGPSAHQPFSVTFPPPYSGPPNNRPKSLTITATATVDSLSQVDEADEGNNQEQIIFSLVPLPNLVPSISCVVDKNSPRYVTIKFGVINKSSVSVGPTICRTWIENKGHASHTIPALGTWKSHTFTRDVFFALAGRRDYSIVVDYVDNVKEVYEDDNTMTGHINVERYKDRFPILKTIIDAI